VPEGYKAPPTIVATCVETATGAAVNAADTAACKAITGAALDTKTACEAVVSAADPTVKACTYTQTTVPEVTGSTKVGPKTQP